MKVDTKKPQPSEFRQDLLRGIRWGTILLIAMLLSIAGYRVLSSSPATASTPKSAEAVAPAVEVEPDAAIKVADQERKEVQPAAKIVNSWEVPEAPVKDVRPARKAPMRTAPQIVEAPQRLHAPAFARLPGASPVAKANGFAAEPLPAAVDAPAPDIELPTPKNPMLAPPPGATDNGKQGNRATRAVRSVGRLFRFGKKDNEAKQGDTSK
jgi:hypothetical protein